MRRPIYAYKDNQAEINNRFAEYLDDKRVAIVGRANLHQLEQGDFIDSHDVVVRVHSTIPYTLDNAETPKLHSHVPEEYRSMVGSRIDIIYHRLYHDPKPFMSKGEIDEHFRAEVSQFKANGGTFFCFADRRNIPLRYTILGFISDVRYVGMPLYASLGQALGKDHIKDGIVIIADILSHSVKSAYITGFPCYFDDMYKTRPDIADWYGARCIKELTFLYELSKHESVSFDPLMMGLFEEHCK